MKDDENFLQQSRQQLDDSIEHLDMATLSRLNQARQSALIRSQKMPLLSRHWLPASVTAALSIAIIGGWLFTNNPAPHNMAQTTQLDDLELITSNTDLELLQDLEFVHWLLEEQNAG